MPLWIQVLAFQFLSPNATEAAGLRKFILDGRTYVVKVQGLDNSPVGLDKATRANMT